MRCRVHLELEYLERIMIQLRTFGEPTGDHEHEKASNSYLMSLVAVIAGLPLPIINLLATFFFFVANRKATQFVRWHCTQALLSQLFLLFINAGAFSWSAIIFFTDASINNIYIGYMLTVIIFNITDLLLPYTLQYKYAKANMCTGGLTGR